MKRLSEWSWKKKVMASIGGVCAALAIILGSSAMTRSAVSELAGLAVAQSATAWVNVRDAAVGDNLTNGILAIGLMLYDGTNFDRARGDITNGLDVDVTRITGSVTPADGFANPTTFLGTFSLQGVFNGTTWDRWRGQVAPVQGVTILNAQSTGVANTALVTTLTGVAATRIHLYKVQGLCVGGGTTTLTVADGATVISSMSVPQNPMVATETWPVGLTATTAANMVITLNACGTGGIGVVTYQADRF